MTNAISHLAYEGPPLAGHLYTHPTPPSSFSLDSATYRPFSSTEPISEGPIVGTCLLDLPLSMSLFLKSTGGSYCAIKSSQSMQLYGSRVVLPKVYNFPAEGEGGDLNINKNVFVCTHKGHIRLNVVHTGSAPSESWGPPR